MRGKAVIKTCGYKWFLNLFVNTLYLSLEGEDDPS